MIGDATGPTNPPPRPGEADTPREAHDAVAPNVRRLREGDDAPQGDAPAGE